MAIYTPNQALANYLPDYQLIRTIIQGDRALKGAGELYVPRLSGQDNNEYNAMISRPSFENYTARVLDGLTGLAFSKDAIIELPSSMDKITEDVSLSELSLNDFATQLVREVLTVGRCGMLVDMPNNDTTGMSLADVERLNVRPYAKIYNSENIINWRYTLVNNVQTLTMVILSEVSETWTTEYDSTTENIYRVLILRNGVYQQEVWREGSKDTWVVDTIIEPLMNGKKMDFIPFVSVTTDKITLEPSKPPMLDLAVVNLSHFKISVDFAHGSHYTALPTAFIWGAQLQDGDKITLGSTSAHVFSDPSGKAEYLEFQGQGLTTLSNEKDVLVNRMASLGARFLAEDKKVAETDSSQQTRSSGERAILIAAVTTISGGITKMLEIMAQWMNISGNISYKLNKDYVLTSIDAQFMKELIVGRQTNDITPKILYNELVKGEVIDPITYTFEDYINDKEAQEAAMSIIPTNEPTTNISTKDENNSVISSIRSKLGLK